MSNYPKDQHGEYQRLHTFIDVNPCHRGGYYCIRQEVRRYLDGVIRVVGGPAIYSREASPETTSMMQIYSAAQFALVCVTKAPK